MSTKTPISFPPLEESIYLARPAKMESSVALQAQRINNQDDSVEPIFDVKANTRPIVKLLKKVKHFNDAVSSIIPEHHINHHHTDNNARKSIYENISAAPCNIDPSKHPSTDKSPKPQSFSVYDRDSGSRTPLAVISRYGVQFSPKSTPLLFSSSRLERLNDTPELAGQVAWAMVPEFSAYNKYKITSFKVVDRSTSKVIGRWKRRSALESSLNPDEFRLQHRSHSTRSLGTTASNRYYLSEPGCPLHRPFFSGGAFSAASAANKLNEEWCFIVTKQYTKSGKTTIKRNVLATLKGFELQLVDPHDQTLRNFYLDEYMRYLRQKGVRKTELTRQDSFSNISSANNSSNTGNSYDYSDNFDLNSINADVSSTSPSFSNFSPTSSTNFSASSTFFPNQSGGHTRDLSFSDNFYRLRVNDAITMMAMCLLLNIDHVILTGLKNGIKPGPLSDPNSIGAEWSAEPTLSASSAPTSPTLPFFDSFSDSFTSSDPSSSASVSAALPQQSRSKSLTNASIKGRKMMHFMNPFNVFRKEVVPKV